MDVFADILLWIHLAALGLGGAASFGLPVVGSKMATANAETRPLLFSIMQRLTRIGRAGFGLLIITGPLIVWLKYGGMAGFNTWFWVKMALVVVLLGLIIYAGTNAKKAEAGDRMAAIRAPTIGMGATTVFLLVIGAAALAFG